MAPRKKKGKGKKSNSVTVDFEGVEAGGTVPEGEWLAEVVEVELCTSKDSGNDYLKWTFKTLKGKVFTNTSLQAHALFNLRGLLEAMDVEVPEGPLDIDFDDMVGMELVVVIEHEKYEGKMKARVTDYMTAEGASEGGEDGEGEEVTVDGKSDGKLDSISEEEVGDLDAEELEDLVTKYGLDVKLKKFKSARKKVGAVVDALEDAGYLEED